MSIFDAIGVVGVVLILAAYFLHQKGDLGRDDTSYQALNAAGSGSVLLSLLFEFNLSAALLEGAWFLISLYGLGRILAARRRAEEA